MRASRRQTKSVYWVVKQEYSEVNFGGKFKENEGILHLVTFHLSV